MDNLFNVLSNPFGYASALATVKQQPEEGHGGVTISIALARTAAILERHKNQAQANAKAHIHTHTHTCKHMEMLRIFYYI